MRRLLALPFVFAVAIGLPLNYITLQEEIDDLNDQARTPSPSPALLAGIEQLRRPRD